MQRTWASIAAVMALAISAGCGKGQQECQVQVADLAEWARGVGGEPPSIVTAANLVVRPDAKDALLDLPVLELTPKSATLDGQPTNAGAVGQMLIEALMKRASRKKGPDTHTSVLVVVDADTPWRTVVEHVSALAENINTLGFVFAVPSTVKPPPRTSVDDEVAKLTAETKVMGMAKILREVIGKCEGIQDTFQALATYQTGDRGEILASGLGHAVQDCRCNVDIPKLKSALYHLLAATPMRLVTVKVQRDATPVVALPADMPWKEASKQVPTELTWFATK